MKSFFINIMNMFPYLFLILIYFFLVNIEAKKSNNSYTKNTKLFTNNLDKDSSVSNENNLIISIPVIPFNK